MPRQKKQKTQARATEVAADSAGRDLEVIKVLRAKFGEGVVMRMSDGVIKPVATISTGSLGLDIATGVGGFPRGRIVEVYGPESSGKTTLALHTIAEAQKAGHLCAFVDAEHALDIAYAKALGVDVNGLLISQPDNGEQALDVVETEVLTGAVGLVVVDSVAALTPRAEIEGDMGASHVGLQARLMSQAMRKLAAATSRSGAVVLFINQTRMKIGVMFGSPETTTGGNALKFYASMRIDVRRIETLKGSEGMTNARGIRQRARVVKNKCAPPFREAEIDILWGSGFSRGGEVLDLATDLGFVDKAGAWFSYGGERIGQGRAGVISRLTVEDELRTEIENKVRTHFGLDEVLL